MSEELKTIEKVKVALTNLNAVLQECRKQDISLQIDVLRSEGFESTMLYCHKDNKINFKLHEAYKLNKFE